MYKKKNSISIKNNDIINIKLCGDIITLTKLNHINKTGKIKKINKDEYILLKTGEVKKFNHSEKRIDNIASARKSVNRLKDYINSNVTNNIKKSRFLTLTYKNKMSDYNQCSNDATKFIKTLKTKKYKEMFHYNSFEYITIYEPQGRNSYHLHIFLIFDKEGVFIPNTKLKNIWKHGYTKIRKLDFQCDNIANYFCYIFSSMTVGEIRKSELSLSNLNKPITKEFVGPRGGKISKRVVKGARLNLMQTNTHLYSISRGIKRAIEYKELECGLVKDAFLQNTKLVNTSTYVITDSNNKCVNQITKEIYKKTD